MQFVVKPHVKRKAKEANVTVTDPSRMTVTCNECGTAWSPNIQPGGRLPRGWWRCPNECNAG
jgi:transposase